jgi:hypothetical protein
VSRYWPIAASLLCCAIPVFTASVAAQSLADVARAEAERRKTIAQPSRVYTNKDLKPVAFPGAPPSAGAEEPSPAMPSGAGKGKRESASEPRADRQATGAKGEESQEEDGDEDEETGQDEEKRRA